METKLKTEIHPEAQQFRKKILNPFLFNFFLLLKLPAAFFMRIKVKKLDQDQAEVWVPYRWRTQNPFRSTYFAAQAAAAEMSTGVLAMLHLQGKGKVSMLITDMKGNYSKKATSNVVFICNEGAKVKATIEKAIALKEGQSVTLNAVGQQKGKNGEWVEVSRFEFTWSFKAKN